MKKRCALWLIVAVVLALLACGQKAPQPLQIINLMDASASIEPEAQQLGFQSLEKVVSSLRRGDSLTVIPVTGNAGNETEGHILRITLAERRETYDQDLRRAAMDLRRSLEQTRTAVLQNPGSQTDILGAFRLASEEIRLAGEGRKAVILALSDFIQDDDQFNFKTNPALKNAASAQVFGADLSRTDQLSLQGVPIFLGLLRSRDLGRMSPQRRNAIKTFWLSYLSTSGATPVLAEDGPGLLDTFLKGEPVAAKSHK
jgi:hypothetical protein